MKSFMWVITIIIVLSTATVITATADVNNDTSSNDRTARFSKGEIPILLIRPVRRPSGLSHHFNRVPISQSRVSYVHDDMSMLGSILPQLGLDPNLFSAYSLGSQSKKHSVPIQQNEIPKYHHSSLNYKPDLHKAYKETDFYPNYSFNFNPPPSPPPPPQHPNIPKTAPLIASNSGHKKQLNLNERYLDVPIFIPTNNYPSEISDESGEKYSSPLNIVNPPSHTYSTLPYNAGNVQSHTNGNNNNNYNNNYNYNNYKTEKHFEPKTIDFNLVKSKEELVIGKQTAPVNLQVTTNTGYKSTDGHRENNFYIPKHENTASFEVKSKTENVRFVPDYITKRNEKPLEQLSLRTQENFKKPSFEQFKQTPKLAYFIPKGQDTAALKVSSDTDEYYKQFETDDYFLPKREPAYHKMIDVQESYNKKPITTTTERPPSSETPESYSFMINDDGYSDIHIQDHVYSEPEQLYYGYDNDSGEYDQSNENQYAQTSFYPSNHKDFDTKLTALDYVQSSIKSNLNNLFEDYETKKTKLISSTYKKDDLIAQPELSFGQFIFSSSTPPSLTSPASSYYFAKSSDDSDELDTYYSTLKPIQTVSTTPKIAYVRPSFSLKLNEVRPIYESQHHDAEHTNENEYKVPSIPTKLYLKERESNNEISTIFPKLSTTMRPPLSTFEPSIVSTTKFPIVFTTPKITTYKSRFSPSFRAPTTVAPPHFISSSTTQHNTFKIETTTEDSGVNLLSGMACERQCIRNTVSQEYDPVCGSDGKTYSNKGKLRCSRTCGKNELHVKHYGGCGQNN